VVGLNLSPSNANALFCRTDVGEAYRWDSTNSVWVPMRVRNADGTGVQGSGPSAPEGKGVESVVVDPSNASTVYMAFPNLHSANVGGNTGVNVYKSTDGGKNFNPGNLNVPGDPNGTNRMDGERLAVDPNNSNIVYYGSEQSGIYRSTDGGSTWNVVTGNGAPGTAEIINMIIYKGGGTTSAFGQTVSSVVYSVQINGDIYRSANGGQSWTNITTGTGISGATNQTTIDQNGALYAVQTSTNGTKAYWRYNGSWQQFWPDINQPLSCVAVDPSNTQNIWALGVDGSLSRSSNGGSSWTNLGSMQFANTLGWLPQTVGMGSYPWRSVGGIHYDAAGNLWVSCGQEGMLRYHPTNSETSASPPKWTITSNGIEELVAQQAVVLPGSGDTMVVASEDTTGFTIPNPDNFSASQVTLQSGIISQSSGVAFCPDAPSYVAITTSDVYSIGKNESGYSSNSGQSWTKFGPALKYTYNGQLYDTQSGSIAVSARGGRWGLGSDHIVTLPTYDFVPQWSHDGGQTWHTASSFPMSAGTISFDGSQGYQGLWTYSLHQNQLMADPFTPDKFYLKLTHSPAGLYVSTDGGQTWQGQFSAGLPDYTHHGQLAVNFKAQNDLWFVDGYEGASAHGVWHSTNGGANFSTSGSWDAALAIALGAGSGVSGDQPYTAYVYGKMTGDANYGVFRSTNGGSSWDRVAYYPTGIFDIPACMTASWDTFGKVYVGFDGNSWVYGAPSSGAAPAFTSSTSVSPSSVQVNTPATVTVSAHDTGGAASGIIIDMEIYNSSGTRVNQQVTYSQSFTAGGTNTYTYNWTPTATGTYTVKVGIDKSDWTSYKWMDPAATFTVTATATNPTATNPTAHSGSWMARLDSAGTSTWKNLYQVIPVTPNTSYNVGSWITGTGSAVLTIFNGNFASYNTSATFTPTSSWTWAGTTFNSGSSTSMTIDFQDGGAAGTLWLDDAGVVAQSGGNNLLSNSDFELGTSQTAWGLDNPPFSIVDPPKAAPPAMPYGLKATGGSAQVALIWSKSSIAKTYNIYRSTTAGGEGTTAYKTSITATSFTDTGLAASTTYYYKVAAVNTAGVSAQSSEASAKTAAH